MNPCTLGWYLPLLVKDAPGALQPSDERPGPHADAPADLGHTGYRGKGKPGAGGRAGEGTSGAWRELDAKFRRDLPDEAYVGRLAYRGLVMRACPRVRMLDGVEVCAKEREKAERLLGGMLGLARARERAGGGAGGGTGGQEGVVGRIQGVGSGAADGAGSVIAAVARAR